MYMYRLPQLILIMFEVDVNESESGSHSSHLSLEDPYARSKEEPPYTGGKEEPVYTRGREEPPYTRGKEDHPYTRSKDNLDSQYKSRNGLVSLYIIALFQ